MLPRFSIRRGLIRCSSRLVPQAVRYLMRYQSEYTCNIMNVARHTAFGWEAAKMVLASSSQNVFEVCHFASFFSVYSIALVSECCNVGLISLTRYLH